MLTLMLTLLRGVAAWVDEAEGESFARWCATVGTALGNRLFSISLDFAISDSFFVGADGFRVVTWAETASSRVIWAAIS